MGSSDIGMEEVPFPHIDEVSLSIPDSASPENKL